MPCYDSQASVGTRKKSYEHKQNEDINISVITDDHSHHFRTVLRKGAVMELQA
jgi:hypothetical protein